MFLFFVTPAGLFLFFPLTGCMCLKTNITMYTTPPHSLSLPLCILCSDMSALESDLDGVLLPGVVWFSWYLELEPWSSSKEFSKGSGFRHTHEAIPWIPKQSNTIHKKCPETTNTWHLSYSFEACVGSIIWDDAGKCFSFSTILEVVFPVYQSLNDVSLHKQ